MAAAVVVDEYLRNASSAFCEDNIAEQVVNSGRFLSIGKDLCVHVS